MPKKSSRSIGRQSIAKEISESVQPETLSGSISSQVVFPAKIFPMPDSGQVLTESEADCSLRPFAWFENCNRERLSWRTWQRCLLEGWIEHSGRWPRSGMMLNGIAYRLPTLVPRISGTGCSSLPYMPTPRTVMPDNLTSGTLNEAGRIVRKSGSDYGINLADWVRLWPTPDVRGFSNEGAIAKLSKVAESWEEFSGMAHRKSKSKKRKYRPTAKATDGGKGSRTEEGAEKELARGKNVDLGVAVKMWPTPTSISPAKNGYNEAGNSCGLVAIRKRISDDDSQATGQLNPMWVEALMGFPIGWTEIDN